MLSLAKLIALRTQENIKFISKDSDYLELSESLVKHTSLMLITDENTSRFCKKKLEERLKFSFKNELVLPPGEAFKNTDQLNVIWKGLFEAGLDRNSAVVNLGGGVVSDIGGFASATFKRGIAVYNIPTSLLSMVDAAIGGKNGINFMQAKNQLGTMTLPEMVVVDTDFLQTLPVSELKSGFAEIIKHALIADSELWDMLKTIKDFTAVENLKEIVQRSIRIKSEITVKDPFEKNDRKLLNFGHTSGHAIEAHFPEKGLVISHGHAVALGMIIEGILAEEKGLLSNSELTEISDYIKSHFSKPLLSSVDIDSIIKIAHHDKKNERGQLNFSLIDRIGHGLINQMADEAEFQCALQKFNELR